MNMAIKFMKTKVNWDDERVRGGGKKPEKIMTLVYAWFCYGGAADNRQDSWSTDNWSTELVDSDKWSAFDRVNPCRRANPRYCFKQQPEPP